MKNFNIFGVHWKSNVEGGLPKKGGAWTVCRFKGREGRGRDLARKRGGGVLEEGLIPQCTLWHTHTYTHTSRDNTGYFWDQ